MSRTDQEKVKQISEEWPDGTKTVLAKNVLKLLQAERRAKELGA